MIYYSPWKKSTPAYQKKASHRKKAQKSTHYDPCNQFLIPNAGHISTLSRSIKYYYLRRNKTSKFSYQIQQKRAMLAGHLGYLYYQTSLSGHLIDNVTFKSNICKPERIIYLSGLLNNYLYVRRNFVKVRFGGGGGDAGFSLCGGQ